MTGASSSDHLARQISATLKALGEKLDKIGSNSPFKVFLRQYSASPKKGKDRSAGETHEKQWKAWRAAANKEELREIFHRGSTELLSELRTQFRSLQGPEWVSPLLLRALSSTGSMSMWNQCCFAENEGETSPLLFDSECELTSEQIKALVQAGTKHGREQLVVVALHVPAPLPGDPAMRNMHLEGLKRRNAGIEPRGDLDFVERDALCATDEVYRIAALYALLPQLDSLSPAQAKWLVYATMAAPRCYRNPCVPEADSFPDLWAVALPANIFAAFEELFLEGDFLDNEGPETLRLAAAERISRAGVESPGEYKSLAVNAFNRALQIVASQTPGTSEAYNFMNRCETALFLDLVVDLEATGCIKAVTDMYHRTDGRMVNHSYPNRFSSENSLGLLDFLTCMGVQTPRGKDVEQSTQRVTVNYKLNAEMLTKLKSDRNAFDAFLDIAAGRKDPNDLEIDPSISEMVHQARSSSVSSHCTQVDERVKKMARSDEGVSARGASCAQCGIESNTTTLLRCGRCKCVWYCNTTCQTSHWKPAHKAVCKPHK